MRVWIDQDLCTGDGLCTDHCPEVFVLLEDGISYVRDVASGEVANDPGGSSSWVTVPPRQTECVIDAALACPGECIFVEHDPVPLVATGTDGERRESDGGDARASSDRGGPGHRRAARVR